MVFLDEKCTFFSFFTKKFGRNEKIFVSLQAEICVRLYI